MAYKERKGFFQSIALNIKSFGIRILVHCCAFIAAIQVSDLAKIFDEGASLLAAYLGFICLIARGTSLQFTWLMPAILGFIQVAFCSILGFSLVQAIFIGGLQSYLLRIYVKKFTMGSEWIVLFFFFIAVSDILPFPNFAFASISFIFLFCAGIIASKSYAHFIKKQEEAKKREYERQVQIEKEKNRDPFEKHRLSIKDLFTKKEYLPQNMQETLLSLGLSAESILQCMAEDTRDVYAGEKFLTRYLPATHTVLDSYKRYEASPQNEAITKALVHSEEVLARLAEAFAQEHAYLLRNDVDDFSADLRVLDTLLKMEGR